MTEPVESFVELPSGRFRFLTCGAGNETVVFLHGLSGVAEVWLPTFAALSPGRRYIAIDQRGHGQTITRGADYSATAMVEDVGQLVDHLGSSSIHLVGHSMGARVVLVAATRIRQLLRSVAMVDIGPEASKTNIQDTVRGISSRPERLLNRAEALAFGFRNRAPTETDERIFFARLEEHEDGSLTWRSSRETLVACVTRQRSRSYWKEWRKIETPALFIHGGASNEVSAQIASRMRTENARVRFERFEGVGHNIPLIAAAQLAASLDRHWTTVAGSAT